MIFIAHRGNINGPTDYENTQRAIDEALAAGYHCEVDVRLTSNGLLCLGHDFGKELIDIQKLVDNRIWCHAKTPETFMYLSKFSGINTFFQNGDAVSLTSRGYFWCHEEYPSRGPKSVLVALDYPQREAYDTYAICTDWPGLFIPDTITNKPKLIVLDVDGVMTDGTKAYDREGKVISKSFYDKDWTAIKRFQSAGIPVVLQTSDPIVNAKVIRDRGLEYNLITPGADKSNTIQALCRHYGVTLEETVFVGDDYYDLMQLEMVGYPFCPKDAVSDVRAVATVLPELGGFGVVEALYDVLRPMLPQVYPADSPDVNPK